MKRLAIFDLDGTLIDSRADLATSGNYVREAIGLPSLPLATVSSFVGDGLDKLIERLVPMAEKRREAKDIFETHYLQHCCDQTRPFVGIVEMLAALQAHDWILAVATNKPGLFTEKILRGCGIFNYFNQVRAGDGARKPDPGQLLDLMACTGVTVQNTWMIGDHHTDVRAGQAAGCRVAFCLWGMGHRDQLSVNAQVASPQELLLALAA
jgi:phosphoglycolate phosphatase